MNDGTTWERRYSPMPVHRLPESYTLDRKFEGEPVKCANPNCQYLRHSDQRFGDYCCFICYERENCIIPSARGYLISRACGHGSNCECIQYVETTHKGPCHFPLPAIDVKAWTPSSRTYEPIQLVPLTQLTLGGEKEKDEVFAGETVQDEDAAPSLLTQLPLEGEKEKDEDCEGDKEEVVDGASSDEELAEGLPGKRPRLFGP